MKKSLLLLIACCLSIFSYSQNNSSKVTHRKYLIVGSYSNGTTSGISVYRFDTQTGDFESVSDLKGVINPSYLAVSEDGKIIYSTNELPEGAVSAFRFDKKDGTLHFLNSQLTEGADPCYITVDKGRNFIVTANYSGGNVSYFPLAKDGSIEPLSEIWNMNQLMKSDTDPAASHMHSMIFSPDNQSLFAADLGFDKIYKFDVKENHSIALSVENTTSLLKGSGPRHLEFHPNKKFLYCINEISGKITAFEYKKGAITPIQYIDSDHTPELARRGSADIHLTPDGRFLYASNRSKNDGIAIFSVNQETGELTRIGYQKTGIHPRNFIISPNGKFLLCANRNSNNVQIFEIDQETGLLWNTDKEIVLNQPVCLKWIAL